MMLCCDGLEGQGQVRDREKRRCWQSQYLEPRRDRAVHHERASFDPIPARLSASDMGAKGDQGASPRQISSHR